MQAVSTRACYLLCRLCKALRQEMRPHVAALQAQLTPHLHTIAASPRPDPTPGTKTAAGSCMHLQMRSRAAAGLVFPSPRVTNKSVLLLHKTSCCLVHNQITSIDIYQLRSALSLATARCLLGSSVKLRAAAGAPSATDDRLYAYEAIGLLLGQEELPAEQQLASLESLTAPLLTQMETHLGRLQRQPQGAASRGFSPGGTGPGRPEAEDSSLLVQQVRSILHLH